MGLHCVCCPAHSWRRSQFRGHAATNGATVDAAHAADSLLGGSNFSHFAATGNGMHGSSAANGDGGGTNGGNGGGGEGKGGGGGGGRPGGNAEGGDRGPKNLRLALDSLVGAAVLAALVASLIHYLGKLRRTLAAFLRGQSGGAQPGSRKAQREHLAKLLEAQATMRCAHCSAVQLGIRSQRRPYSIHLTLQCKVSLIMRCCQRLETRVFAGNCADPVFLPSRALRLKHLPLGNAAPLRSALQQ